MKRWLWPLLAGGGAFAAIAVAIARTQNPIKESILSAVRTPQMILDAVADIDPEDNPELQVGYLCAGCSWCNKFMYLVTAALGAPLPWGEYGTLVNEMIDYVDRGEGGWYPLSSATQAQQEALAGRIAIATYRNLNPGAHGHMALVLPIAGAVQIAQAGMRNFNQGSVAKGFGFIQPIFYGHA